MEEVERSDLTIEPYPLLDSTFTHTCSDLRNGAFPRYNLRRRPHTQVYTSSWSSEFTKSSTVPISRVSSGCNFLFTSDHLSLEDSGLLSNHNSSTEIEKPSSTTECVHCGSSSNENHCYGCVHFNRTSYKDFVVDRSKKRILVSLPRDPNRARKFRPEHENNVVSLDEMLNQAYSKNDMSRKKYMEYLHRQQAQRNKKQLDTDQRRFHYSYELEQKALKIYPMKDLLVERYTFASGAGHTSRSSRFLDIGGNHELNHALLTSRRGSMMSNGSDSRRNSFKGGKESSRSSKDWSYNPGGRLTDRNGKERAVVLEHRIRVPTAIAVQPLVIETDQLKCDVS